MMQLSYFMDAEQMAAAIEDMDKAAIDIAGIYHSHVWTPAYPSRRDLELAYFPDVLYVIISLTDPDHPEVRGFRIKDG